MEITGIFEPNAEQNAERLTDERLGDLVSAVGNNEAKAALLLAMRGGHIYKAGDLIRAFLAIQGTDPAWKIDYKTPFGYCSNSFVPIGLVAKEVIDPAIGTWGFMKTDFGEEVGDSLAGYTLMMSERYPSYTLSRVWGSTSTYKFRAPAARIKIFRELVASNTALTESDLARRTGLRADLLSKHLRSLGRNKILKYEWTPSGEPYAYYRTTTTKPQTSPPPFPQQSILTARIWEVLENQGTVTTEKVLQELHLAPTARTRITGILNYLIKIGYAAHENFHRTVQSKVELTPQQRQMLNDWVNLLNTVQERNKTGLREGKIEGLIIVGDSNKIRPLLQKAKEASSQFNKLPEEETRIAIATFFREDTQNTVQDIQRKLKDKFGHNLTEGQIQQILRKMKKDGSVISSKVKGRLVFSLRE